MACRWYRRYFVVDHEGFRTAEVQDEDLAEEEYQEAQLEQCQQRSAMHPAHYAMPLNPA